MILPIRTSTGRVGMESRFSMVPRSRSRVIARPVIMTIVIVRTTPIRPGHDVVLRDRFGVVERVDAQIDGPSVPARKASGPLRSFCSAVLSRVRKEPRALPVAAGSVASASTRRVGRSPRRRSRVKFSGMLMTNWTSPRASTSRASASVFTSRTKSK